MALSPVVRSAIGFAALALCSSPSHAVNLVSNGDFESFTGASGPGQIAPAIRETGGADIGRILTNWTKQCLLDCSGGNFNVGSQGFAFVLDGQADSTGFESRFSPPNIKVWGPASGSSNGFQGSPGSPDGGFFVGIDGSYGRSSLSQMINNLTVGQTYNLKFYYAGSQFTDVSKTDPNNATDQYWQVQFGAETQVTPTRTVDAGGFAGWLQASMNFMASSVQQELKFTAFGGAVGGGPNFAPSGLPPFLLLDGVQLGDPNNPPSPSVPGPLPVFGAAATLVWSRKLRLRIGKNKKNQ